ncbi:hypothetical protein BT93_H2619 [Corymbia citriodora subsp. variegata]|nr:hypothetical protein BT93_H2619 [Corymbia citriodora subsp. variegata]
MVVFKSTDEYSSPIPAARFFKALIVDCRSLIPKLMPQAIESIDIVQGDGGAGSIMQINFTEGGHVSGRVEVLNEETFTFMYALMEGGPLMEKFESIAYEVKFAPTPDGGSKNRMSSTYYTKDDAELEEEEIKVGRDRGLGIYKAVEAYLLHNLDTYV